MAESIVLDETNSRRGLLAALLHSPGKGRGVRKTKSKANFLLRVWQEYGLVLDFDGDIQRSDVARASSRKGGMPRTWKQWKDHVLWPNAGDVGVLIRITPDNCESVNGLYEVADAQVVEDLLNEVRETVVEHADAVISSADEALEESEARASQRVERLRRQKGKDMDSLRSELENARRAEALDAHVRDAALFWCRQSTSDDEAEERAWVEKKFQEAPHAEALFAELMAARGKARRTVTDLNAELKKVTDELVGLKKRVGNFA